MGSKSSSASSNATTTTNTDNRQVISGGGFGITGSTSQNVTFNNESLDAEIVKKAFDTFVINDSINGQGFSQLLGLADKMFTGAGEIISTAQNTTLKQIDSINTAQTDSAGQVSQKTLIILAVAGAGFLALRGHK